MRAVAGVAGVGSLARLVLAFFEVLAQRTGFSPPPFLGPAFAAAAVVFTASARSAAFERLNGEGFFFRRLFFLQV